MKQKIKKNIVFIFVLSLVFLATNNIVAAKAKYAELEKAIIVQLNKERTKNSLPPLTFNPLLRKAAEMKLKDMIRKNYFAHTSPEGVGAWHWFRMVKYDYKYAGENLASNFQTAHQVHRAWLKSTKHRKNMLFPNYQEVAVAIGKDKKGNLLAVELFGTKMPVNVLSKVEEEIKEENRNQYSLQANRLEVLSSTQNQMPANGIPITANKSAENTKNGAIKQEEGLTAQDAEFSESAREYTYFKYINSTTAPVMAFLCFILLLDVWVLEKEDKKVMDITTGCKIS